MRNKPIRFWASICLLVQFWPASAESIDLLKQYPTTVTEAKDPEAKPRQWEFTEKDLFQLSRFTFEVNEQVRVRTGAADLGIGHCADGAVWAVIIPREEGTVMSPATNSPEAVSHVWLRFHPKQITRLFPPETVSAGAQTNLLWQMRAIANAKITSSWQAGGRALIPPVKDMTLDVDVRNGLRRFFVVDRQAATAKYVPAFEHRPVRLPPPLTRDLAESAFDQIREAC